VKTAPQKPPSLADWIEWAEANWGDRGEVLFSGFVTFDPDEPAPRFAVHEPLDLPALRGVMDRPGPPSTALLGLWRVVALPHG
jgi:hypothetical protein